MERQAVLVTGGSGYLGSVLTRKLATAGHAVTAVDNYLTSTPLANAPGVRQLEADIRDVGKWTAALAGIDSVIHLASIVGDAACDIDHDLTWDTNYLATVALVEACRAARVKRFLLASTCSNYGMSQSGSARTLSPMQPKSLYAQTKIYAEHHVLSSRSANFHTSILRLATLYGLSPRMRFDLAVNTMTAMAVRQRRVVVHGGNQWRPFLHVEDAAQAFILALTASVRGSSNGVYNCGSDDENYRISDIGKIIVREVPGSVLTIEPSNVDPRNYRVDCSSARLDLGLRPRWTISDGVSRMAEALSLGQFGPMTDSRYSNLAMVTAATNLPGEGQAPASPPRDVHRRLRSVSPAE